MKQTGATVRLSWEQTRQFVSLLRSLMRECQLSSIYHLCLEIDAPRSRATIHRWLCGEVRVPLAGARALVDAIANYAKQWQDNKHLIALDELLGAQSLEQSPLQRLEFELRIRRVPVARTVEALRAVSLLPSVDQEIRSVENRNGPK